MAYGRPVSGRAAVGAAAYVAFLAVTIATTGQLLTSLADSALREVDKATAASADASPAAPLVVRNQVLTEEWWASMTKSSSGTYPGSSGKSSWSGKSFLGALFGGGSSSGRSRDDDDDYRPRKAPQLGYRTMCVRLCDGYYFPISNGTTSDNLERDAQLCESRCATPARLYTMRYHDTDPARMQSLKGEEYGKLETAFRYRTSYEASCTCKAHPWEEASTSRHRLHALEEKAGKGDKTAASWVTTLKPAVQAKEDEFRRTKQSEAKVQAQTRTQAVERAVKAMAWRAGPDDLAAEPGPVPGPITVRAGSLPPVLVNAPSARSGKSTSREALDASKRPARGAALSIPPSAIIDADGLNQVEAAPASSAKASSSATRTVRVSRGALEGSVTVPARAR